MPLYEVSVVVLIVPLRVFKSSIALSNSALVAKEASSFIEAASKYVSRSCSFCC
jgi:hypothetical protein